MKRALLLAAIAVLPLTAACNDKEAPAKATDGTAVTPPDPGAPAAGRDSKNGGAPPEPVPAAEIARYKALAACVRKNGVDIAEPEAGKPWDTKAMDSIAITPKWSKVLDTCPDWKKLVVGVG